jgi:hypothetical protein
MPTTWLLWACRYICGTRTSRFLLTCRVFRQTETVDRLIIQGQKWATFDMQKCVDTQFQHSRMSSIENALELT